MGRGKFLRSLRQRWWLLALLVVPVTLGTLFYTVMKPAEWEAFMTLADRRERDLNISTLYDVDALGASVNEQEIRVLNLANTISSFSVLKSAYDELGPTGRKILPAGLKLDDFMAKVSVNPLRGTEYLQVSYIGTNPEQARTVVDTIREKFMNRYSQLNSAAGRQRTEFIRAQLKQAQAEYNQKLEEQKQFAETHPNSAAYEASTQALVGRLNEVKRRMDQSEQILASAEGQYATASQQVRNAEINKGRQTVNTGLNPNWSELTSRVNATRARLEGLLKTRGEAHPEVVAARAALAEDENLLKSGKVPKFIQSTVEGSFAPAMQEAMTAKYAAERALSASRREKENSLKAMAEIQAEMKQLPVIQKQLTALQAELAAKAEAVKNFTAKLSESQVRTAKSENPTIYMLDDPMYREVPRGTVLKTAVALFLSLLVAVSLIASLGQVDQGTYTPVEAENSLGFPVLAVLPKSSQQRLSTGQEQPTALAASYQILSTEVMSLKERLVGPGILVAAAEPDSGRSTIAANLAISLARDGARVLLIDSDLRSPSMHANFGLENRAGLSEVLQGTASVENVVQPTGVDGLLFIAAGQPPVNPVRLFRGEQMDQFIELVSKGADYIVFDSPAGSTFGDAQVLAAQVQNVVLVHEAGRAPSIAEYEFHKSLERLGVNIIGMVLNKARPEDCPAYQHFRRKYETQLSRYRTTSSPAALGSGDKPVREKPQQYGAKRDDEDE